MTEEEADEDLRSWRLFEIDNDALNEHFLIRLKMTKPAHPDVDLMKAAISISWPYESDSSMPSAEVNALQLDFERAIDPMACENDNSELVQVTTGGGSKEWLFYAWSQDLFLEQLNIHLRSHPAYPIQIQLYDDPNWSIWKQAVQRLGEHAA